MHLSNVRLRANPFKGVESGAKLRKVTSSLLIGRVTLINIKVDIERSAN
jgi:hypothetical protein